MASIVLTPVASVDTTNCSVTMNVFIPSSFYTDNTLIQIEYNIYDSSFSSSGFLSYESGWSQPGISNQLTIGIPCTDEPIDYSGSTNVRVRAYFGSLSSASITVTDWSNSQPFYNPPEQPVISNAFLSSGVSHSPPDDIINVLLEYNPSYFGMLSDTNPAVKFIVSYNYTDFSGNVQWEVSSLINGEKVTVNTDSFILLDPISFVGASSDVDSSFNLNVAVNAVYEFSASEDVNSFYYSVSTISETVQAQPLEPAAAFLEALNYHIYDATPNQSITLNWAAPVESVLINIDHYVVYLSINDQPFEAVSGNLSSSTTTFDWTITPSTLYTNQNTTNKLSFVVNTYYGTQYYPSNEQHVQTFSYAGPPRNLSYRFAIPNDGGVSIVFSFMNPIDKGQGTTPIFNYDIVMSNGTTVSDTVTYVAGSSHVYTVNKFIQNTTATTGNIYVYMNTNNTNPQNQPLRGATSSAFFNVVNVPIIESIEAITNEFGLIFLNVVILSGEDLGQYNQLVFNNGGQLTKQSFEISPNTGYTVDTVILSNGVIQYTYQFSAAFFPGSLVPTNIVVCASNTAGIGARVYPYVV